MNNNKKLLIYGSAAALVLVVVIVSLFSRLFSSSPEEESGGGKSDFVYRAVPSDAVMVCDFKRLGDFSAIFRDTSSFGYYLTDPSNGLVNLQNKLSGYKELQECPFLYSLHYSAKNSVSFLMVADLSAAEYAGSPEEAFISRYPASSKRKYNDAVIYSFPDGLNLTFYKGRLLGSTSAYVLESSIRHLENRTSILDNPDFSELLQEKEDALYINHHQIGKFFSGTVGMDFLGYSDFFLRLSSWSRFHYKPQGRKLELRGYLLNRLDEKYYSTLFCGQSPRNSGMGEILPASAIFAVSMTPENVSAYLADYRKFLEVHKKLGDYDYRLSRAKNGNSLSPQAWIDSLKVEEIVAAYCRFGEKCEWLTFIREKSLSGLDNLLSKVMEKEQKPRTEPFPFKGYMSALFGEIFSHCNEESYCKKGDWIVIGPAGIVEQFAGGQTDRFTLESYMEQTPAGSFLKKEGSVKAVANLKEGGDSLLKVWKPYPAKWLKNSQDNTNFEFVTMNLALREEKIGVEVDYYNGPLEELPRPEPGDEKDRDAAFMIDSTIIISKGPFELKDFTNGGKCYLEQTANNRIRYMDGKKKAVWAIPFDTPICGRVEQADLYKNGKLQMIFVSGKKLYALDRLGRYVKGYPVTLSKEVVYGPRLFDPDGDLNYSLMVLNEDNSISRYRMNGEKPADWNDIKTEEFVKELPDLIRTGERNYWVVRTVTQTRIYSENGREITGKDKKKRISRESPLVAEGGRLRFTGDDGKEYLLDLENGKIKKP